MIKIFTEKILKAELRASVRVRSKATTKGDRIVYQSVPNLKTDLINKVFELRSSDTLNRLYPTYPLQPVRE